MEYPQNLTVSERRWSDLIQQCRASGKSDAQWLQEHEIKSLKQVNKHANIVPAVSYPYIGQIADYHVQSLY